MSDDMPNPLRVFGTPNGKKALQHLIAEFDHAECFTPNPRLTDYLLGQKSVITHIREALSNAEISTPSPRRSGNGRRQPARERTPADGPYFPSDT